MPRSATGVIVVFSVSAGFRRTGADGDGRLVCRLGTVLCPSGMEDQREFRREAESDSRYRSESVWRTPGSVVIGAAGVHAPPFAGPPLASAPSPLCEAIWDSDAGADGIRWLRIGDRGRVKGEGKVESGDFANVYSGEVITRSRKNLIHQTTTDNGLTSGNRASPSRSCCSSSGDKSSTTVTVIAFPFPFAFKPFG